MRNKNLMPLPMSRYDVYADLSRQLTNEERRAIFEALETIVPGSGCVGPQKRAEDEVYFMVEAPSDDEASALAAHYMNTVLKHAGVEAQYTLALQTLDGGFRAWTT
ncbi:MAG TPA: hypothetical protein VFM05_02270 [Candidatus Saccharimonadales bacterium]|nr:hypothetical protein [Candidatus Saccharimonadales bacterium]